MSALAPGATVVVLAGLAAGLRGRLVERSKVRFGPLDTWAVDFGGHLGVRTIRSDYLRQVAA